MRDMRCETNLSGLKEGSAGLDEVVDEHTVLALFGAEEAQFQSQARAQGTRVAGRGRDLCNAFFHGDFSLVTFPYLPHIALACERAPEEGRHLGQSCNREAGRAFAKGSPWFVSSPPPLFPRCPVCVRSRGQAEGTGGRGQGWRVIRPDLPVVGRWAPGLCFALARARTHRVRRRGDAGEQARE